MAGLAPTDRRGIAPPPQDLVHASTGGGGGYTTAAQVLTAIKTVDGTGSGLDADLLDGNDSTAFQAADADLTTIAGLTPSNGDTMQYASGAWANRTPAQARTALGLGNLATATTLPVSILVAVSDEATAITTGTAKVTFRWPFAFTLTEVRASLNTVSSSGNPAVDVNQGGASIFSTTLTIDANEKTSTTAATPAVISTSAMTDDAEVTVDIDTAGTGAKGLKLVFIGTKTA